jgi:hypothetical protein
MPPALVDRGFSVTLGGEKHWIEVEPATRRVTVDLQYHGMMGQPGEVERVGEGVWDGARIVDRTGVMSPAAFDAVEAALRAHADEARTRD